MSRNLSQKRQQAFRMRVEKSSVIEIARQLRVSPNTIAKWEKGWVDSKGRRHKGWQEELGRLWKEQEEHELTPATRRHTSPARTRFLIHLYCLFTRLKNEQLLFRNDILIARADCKILIFLPFSNLQCKSASDSFLLRFSGPPINQS